MRARLCAFVCTVAVLACGTVPPAVRPTPGDGTTLVRVTFVPLNDSFLDAAREYRGLWAAEGPKIVRTMERVSGLRFAAGGFADTDIAAIVKEAVSNSGYRDKPMTLRASYPLDTKREALIHELGHRLESDFFHQGEDDHQYLFLWVYDVWIELYGQTFADSQVKVERARGGVYPAAWDSALSLDAVHRAQRWRQVVAERRARGTAR